MGRLPSVTTILGIINKPGLQMWQARQGSLKAVNVMDNLREKSPFIYDAIYREMGQDFFRDGNSLGAEAADYGRQAHAIIEGILRDQLVLLADCPEPVRLAVESFLDWHKRSRFRVIKTESLVYSERFRYAGTLDAVGETVDGVTLLDWKTSRAIYPEYKLQAVAYKNACEEMTGESIKKVMICRFGKDGSFEDYTIPDIQHPDLFDRFIDAKRLWEWQREENLSFEKSVA